MPTDHPSFPAPPQPKLILKVAPGGTARPLLGAGAPHYLREDRGVVGRLVLLLLVRGSLLHLLPVRFLFPICTFRLKNKADLFIYQASDAHLSQATPGLTSSKPAFQLSP